MRVRASLLAGICASAISFPAFAQDAAEERLLDAREAPASQVLEALADALTSLEYYIEGVGRREDRNVDLLKLAQSSLDDVGL